MEFDWDRKKEASNIAKHDTNFAMATLAFSDPNRIIARDQKHSANEIRYFCFGKVNGTVLTVRFTLRNGIIRIFGAGNWRKGRKIYEQANS
ncbi:MAG: BrnT family toxin [Chthoniobacteraceae bacterium]